MDRLAEAVTVRPTPTNRMEVDTLKMLETHTLSKAVIHMLNSPPHHSLGMEEHGRSNSLAMTAGNSKADMTIDMVEPMHKGLLRRVPHMVCMHRILHALMSLTLSSRRQ